MSAGFYWVLFIANGWNESVGFSLVLLAHLGDVELQLVALKDVAISPATLAWPGREAGVNTASVELVLKSLVEDTGGLSLLNLAQNIARLLDSLCILLDFADTDAVVLLVPLLERGCIDWMMPPFTRELVRTN